MVEKNRKEFDSRTHLFAIYMYHKQQAVLPVPKQHSNKRRRFVIAKLYLNSVNSVKPV